MQHFETIIIGGGPAGVATGISLLKHGKSCCIIDKQQFPRDKTCGGLLTQKTIDLLEELELSRCLEDFYIHKTNRLRLLARNREIVTFDCKHDFHLTNRKIFDNLLIEEFKKRNGTLFENEKAIGINFQEKIVTTDKQQIKYDYLVCADGSKSLSNKLIKKKTLGFTIEADIPAGLFPFDHQAVGLDILPKIDGYGWIFPKKEYVTIGLGGSYKKGRNFLKMFRQYLNDYGISPQQPVCIKGATLPSGHNDGKAVVPEAGILLVGDAAGMVDSVTGEGIYFALKSGSLAAQAILQGGNVTENYQNNCQWIFDIVNRSHRAAQVAHRYKQFLMLFAKNSPARLARVCENEVAYYKYGYNYNVRKKIFSFLWRR